MTSKITTVLAVGGLALTLVVSPAKAQSPEMKLTATSVNVSEAGQPVKINIVRWSTDEERNALVLAMTSPAAAQGNPAGGRNPEVARRIASDEFADFQARSVLTNSCTECHTLERVDAATYTGDKWKT